ncbi:MAG TPA: ABC transporter substrate-binding protein [Thermomicrobiales bacterium]|nr:ABC transporter substrate-binding protein [Thermomicrobiales bacterium]
MKTTRRRMLGTMGAAGLVATGMTGRIGLAQDAPAQRITIGKPYELRTLDPHSSTDQTAWEIQSVVYESLVFLEYQDGAFETVPGLAESIARPDDTTYVFSIREGVTFHNSREMTADDVVFSLNRVLDPEIGAWWRTRLGPPVASAATATPVAAGVGVSFEATGPYEVTARLTEPYSPFLQALAATVTAIVPGAEVESGEIDLNTQMVGTGPFKVTDHAEDQHWIMARHEGYWQEGLPLVDELAWQIMPDESARLAALRNGDIQITTFDNPVMLDLAQSEATISIEEQLTTNSYLMLANAAHPQLAVQEVRQAISLALDRQQLVDVGISGRASVSGPVPVGFATYATPVEELPLYTRDVEGAKALLAGAGYADGLDVTLMVLPVLTVTVPMAELMREQLAEVGIRVEIVQKDLASFVQAWAVDHSAQLTLLWFAGFTDPYLMLLNFLSESFNPIVGAEGDGIDPLLHQLSVASAPDDRTAILKAIEEQISSEAYLQFIASRNNFVAWRNDVLDGVALQDADGYGLPYWHGVQQWSAES